MWRTVAQTGFAVIGSAMGAITLSRLIAAHYPSTDLVNNLYAGVFLPVFLLCGLVCYTLLQRQWSTIFWRAWSWWPLPLLLTGVWA